MLFDTRLLHHVLGLVILRHLLLWRLIIGLMRIVISSIPIEGTFLVEYSRLILVGLYRMHWRCEEFVKFKRFLFRHLLLLCHGRGKQITALRALVLM